MVYYSFFQFPFCYILEIVLIWPLYHSLDKRIWLRLSFYFSKRVRSILSKIIFAFSYSFKITCIILRHVISHKKMVVSSAKFTIFISWSATCIPLIILSLLMKLTSASIAIMHNIKENRQLWRTRIMVKGSDRKRFILILDSMFVYYVNQL